MKARGDGTIHMLEFGGLVLIIAIRHEERIRRSPKRLFQ
jgi:hypothetical protein